MPYSPFSARPVPPKRLLSSLIIVGLLLATSSARAEDVDDAGVTGAAPYEASFAALGAAPGMLGALRGPFAAAARSPSGPRGGVVLGVDVGWAGLLGSSPDNFQSACTFGVRGGYQFASGIALLLRYDDLGVRPWPERPSSSTVQTGTFGLRYTLPFVVPLPFVEAMFGPSFYGDSISPSGGVGVGASVPIGRHVLIDLAWRDRLVPILGDLRQVFTVELGVAVSFASPGG